MSNDAWRRIVFQQRCTCRPGDSMPTILVFSHLRWNFVYQRPQHLLSRLAATRPVFFIEEPEYDPYGPVGGNHSPPLPNVTVLRPGTPVQAPGSPADQLAALEPLMADL